MGFLANVRKRLFSTAANPGVYIDAGGGVFYGLDSENTARLIVDDTFTMQRSLLEASPAINIASRVIGRIMSMVDMKLLRENGDEYNGRSLHPVLKLWNNYPNEYQTAKEFRAQCAQELVFTGEMMARVKWQGNQPVRLSLWDASVAQLDIQSIETTDGPTPAIRYFYDSDSFVLDSDQPQLVHVRQNPYPFRASGRPLRGRPSVYGMRYEILANIWATVYRSEVFRQGGPPRLALERDVNAPQQDPDFAKREKSTLNEASQVAETFSATVKSSQSFRKTMTTPQGWKVVDLGPKSTTDLLLINGSRHTDEKILAAYGVPVLFANNHERSTYSNSRTEDRKLVRDAVAPLLELIGSSIETSLLYPMGGINERLKVDWDMSTVLEAEAVIWNKMVLDRFNAKLITAEEAREELGYEPDGAPEEPEPTDDTDADDESS